MYITLLKKNIKNNLKLKTNRIVNVINTNKALITYYICHNESTSLNDFVYKNFATDISYYFPLILFIIFYRLANISH